MNLTKINNLEEAKIYLKSPWDKSLKQGLFFSSLLELGEDIRFEFIVNSESIFFLHSIYDGSSALQEVEENFKLGLNLPTDTKSPPNYSLFSKFNFVMNALKKKTASEFQFKNIENDKVSRYSNDLLHIKLSESETESLIAKSKSNKANLTSTLLYTFNKILGNMFLKQNTETSWMVPVNIRNEVACSTKMISSYVKVNCSKEDSPLTIKESIKTSLINKEHLGLYYVGNLLVKLGKVFIMVTTKKELEKPEPKWFASLSNLGNIGGSSEHEILITPTVRFHRPLAIATYIFGNQLNIVLRVNKNISKDIDLKDLKNEISKSFS